MRDLNDLRLFAAVVTHGGFSAASRALNVPKSRLSRRIALLEDQLGIRLLERSTRRVALTDVGREVYEHARAAVIEAESVDDVALRRQAEPRGLVRLSCPLGMEPVLAALLPGFLESFPLVRLQCVVSNRRMDLIEENVDVAIRVRERLDTDPTLQVRRIGSSRRILVASPTMGKALEEILQPEHLLAIPLLDHREGRSGSWHLIGPNGATQTITVEPRFSSGSFQLLLASARAGSGIAYLPAPNCRDDLASGALVRVLPSWGGPDEIVHLVFTTRRGMLPSVRAAIEVVAQRLKLVIEA